MTSEQNQDPLLAIDVTPDAYATIASHDQNTGVDALAKDTQVEENGEEEEEEVEEVEDKRASRTRFTEEDFLRQKEGYEARIDEGEIWKQLQTFTPPFQPSNQHFPSITAAPPPPSSSSPPITATDATSTPTSTSPPQQPNQKTKLDKKKHQTLQSAVAELYWKEDFDAVLEIVKWARECFFKDDKFVVQLGRWEDKALRRLEKEREKEREAEDGEGAKD